MTTFIISEEGHPTGQRMRVSIINMRLTFEQEILDDLLSNQRRRRMA